MGTTGGDREKSKNYVTGCIFPPRHFRCLPACHRTRLTRTPSLEELHFPHAIRQQCRDASHYSQTDRGKARRGEGRGGSERSPDPSIGGGIAGAAPGIIMPVPINGPFMMCLLPCECTINTSKRPRDPWRYSSATTSLPVSALERTLSSPFHSEMHPLRLSY